MTLGGLLYATTAGACAALGTAGVAAWAWRDARFARLLWVGSATVLLALAVAAWAHRWNLAGHLPLFGTYESALSLSVAILAAAWVYEWRRSFRAGVAPLAALVAAGLLAHGLRFDATPYALTISERSLLVDLHAILAWSAFGVMASNAALSVAILVRRDDSLEASRHVENTLKLGFSLHSGMLASGSIYKFLLFGKAWSFDPIEILGFLTWVSYGTLLHLSLLGNWRARRLAGWCVFGFLVLVLSYRAIVYFPAWSTYHILDVDLRMHIPG